MSMEMDNQIEAILFWKGEALSIAELARMLKVPSGEIKKGLAELQVKLSNRGLTIVRTDNEVALVTAPSAAPLLEQLQKEELSKDIGRAGLETLSIILYRSPISRRDIEYIRGVNSTSILRTLLIRGLIEREHGTADERVFNYSPTIALLSMLGIGNREKLPEFEIIKNEMDQFEKSINDIPGAENKETEENAE